MDTITKEPNENKEFELIKSELSFSELEERLEMVQVASSDEQRCTIHGDDACKYP